MITYELNRSIAKKKKKMRWKIGKHKKIRKEVKKIHYPNKKSLRKKQKMERNNQDIIQEKVTELKDVSRLKGHTKYSATWMKRDLHKDLSL